MVDATIDNTPVSVTLGGSETYSPANGSVEDVTIVIHKDEHLQINGENIVAGSSGSGEDNTEQIDVVLTDSDTVKEKGLASSRGVHISGYQVSSS